MKVLHSVCQQIWKTQQWALDWKRSVSFQSQRKAMPKNAQTTALLLLLSCFNRVQLCATPETAAHQAPLSLGFSRQEQNWSGVSLPSPKWALGSINMNKASGGDRIPVELFQILKDDAVKVLHSICQHVWKTQQWPQNWKRSVFIPIPKERQCLRMLKLPHNCTHLTC